jgi:hypothetical protein
MMGEPAVHREFRFEDVGVSAEEAIVLHLQLLTPESCFDVVALPNAGGGCELFGAQNMVEHGDVSEDEYETGRLEPLREALENASQRAEGYVFGAKSEGLFTDLHLIVGIRQRVLPAEVPADSQAVISAWIDEYGNTATEVYLGLLGHGRPDKEVAGGVRRQMKPVLVVTIPDGEIAREALDTLVELGEKLGQVNDQQLFYLDGYPASGDLYQLRTIFKREE